MVEIIKHNMSASQFNQLATDYIEKIAEKIEQQDKNYLLEIECNDGVLEVSSKKGIYVINRHQASEKIWYSSPFTGANYFSYKGGEWLDAEGKKLSKIFFLELQEHLKITI